jgi:hypothetical protein
VGEVKKGSGGGGERKEIEVYVIFINYFLLGLKEKGPPSLQVCLDMLQLASDKCDIPHCMLIVDDMRKLQMKPPRAAFNAMLTHVAKREDFAKCNEILLLMKLDSLIPSPGILEMLW